jgi:hypothetical protein
VVTLSERALTILREVGRTLLDDGRGVSEDRLDFVISELRDVFRYTGAKTRVAVWLSLYLVELCPPLVVGRLSRFTRLSPADRLRCLERLETGRLWMIFVPLKLFVCVVYYEHPAALAETGCDSRALKEPAAPRASLSPARKEAP